MARARSAPVPPRPDLARSPMGRFGWLDAALLHDGWLARIGTEAVSVLVLLAIAADRHGASFFGRTRMAQALRLDRAQIDAALAALVECGLVAFRPWSAGAGEGVWQLLPVPRAVALARAGRVLDVKAVLDQLGLAPSTSAAPIRSDDSGGITR